MHISRVNQHGQVTLPSGIRKHLAIAKGTTLEVKEHGNEIVLKKIRVVSEAAFEKISELAKSRGISHREMLRLSREVGREIEK